ncbi:MAG TPA: hypothetical protein VH639_03085 [Bryobacteraceae bacterium]
MQNARPHRREMSCLGLNFLDDSWDYSDGRTKEEAEKQIDESLNRLKTARVDPSGSTPKRTGRD